MRTRCAVSFPTCEYCGRIWTRSAQGGWTPKYCNDDRCRKAHNAARMKRLNREYAERNGATLWATRYDRNREQRAETKREYRARVGYTESKRAFDARRRALKVGATVEIFTNREIFERDGWACGICAESVDPNLVYP